MSPLMRVPLWFQRESGGEIVHLSPRLVDHRAVRRATVARGIEQGEDHLPDQLIFRFPEPARGARWRTQPDARGGGWRLRVERDRVLVDGQPGTFKQVGGALPVDAERSQVDELLMAVRAAGDEA